ncbi:MAG: alpha-N-arabinofuranosidase [Promethearchaeota archaeon]
MGIKGIVSINTNNVIDIINPNIYGHFAEHLGRLIYDGIWVGQDSDIPNINGIRKDIVEALKKIKPPIVRWPGGCFADDYHWKDGIGPREERPQTVNIHWNSIEPNEFGTHEFFEFCELIGAKPYICCNVGSSTPREMREWLEYLNYDGDSTLARLRAENGHPEPFNIRYWGIGNENWGCGGNMSPKYYAYQYKKFAAFAHSFNDQELYKIACGPPAYHYPWTRGFFRNLCENKIIGCPWRLPLINGFALHYYVLTERPSIVYTEKQWYETLQKARKMEGYIKWHSRIIRYFDKRRTVDFIIDEWGTWHQVEENTKEKWLYQQNTISDALVAAITLDIFNSHADKVSMANIAQTVNVLQAMILTKGKDMILTPTYHVYKLYSSHQGGESLETKYKTSKKNKIPLLSGSCSKNEDMLTLSLVNSHARKDIKVNIKIKGLKDYRITSLESLNSEDIHDHNTFEDPNRVEPIKKDAVQENIILPAASVNIIQIKTN